jgi:hypothetical protein
MLKRVLLFLVLILVAVAVYWVVFKPKKNKVEGESEKPLVQNQNSDAFTASFTQLMTSYYSLKDALVEWDTAKVNKQAAELKVLADSLPLSQLKADTSIIMTATDYTKTISGEAVGIIGENDIAEKRRSFYTLSDALYTLVMTVKYDQEVVYHQHCPMAFDETQEAFWLSNSNKVVNPYLGNKHPKYKASMLHCGDVTDSLDFRKK